MELKNPLIRKAKKAVERTYAKQQETIASVVSECKHVQVGECDYEPSKYSFGSATPPARVCLHCGLVEDGWHCGYLILKNSVVLPITREKMYSLRTVHFDAEDQGPLLRHEISLNELVRKKLGIWKEPKSKRILQLI